MKKKLLFLGCNHNQVSYLKLINKNDWKLIGVDLNKDAPGKNLCDKFYNVGTGIRTSLKELAEIIVELTDCKKPIKYAPRSSATLVKNRIGCPNNARKEINYS